MRLPITRSARLPNTGAATIASSSRGFETRLDRVSRGAGRGLPHFHAERFAGPGANRDYSPLAAQLEGLTQPHFEVVTRALAIAAGAAIICMARSLFWCWLRSFWQLVTRPVGMWVIRTAESVTLT